MSDQEWPDLIEYLSRAAHALFRGTEGTRAWEDAVQEACLAICRIEAAEGVDYPKALGRTVLRRARKALRWRNARMADPVEVPGRAVFDARMLTSDWILQARDLIPPSYRAIVLDIDHMSRLHVGIRENAMCQRAYKAKRFMRIALNTLG